MSSPSKASTKRTRRSTNNRNDDDNDVADVIPSSVSSTTASSSTTVINKQKKRRKTAAALRVELAQAEHSERMEAVKTATTLSQFFHVLIELTESHLHHDQDVDANQCTRETTSIFTMFALPSGPSSGDHDRVESVKLESKVTNIDTEGDTDVSAVIFAEQIGELVAFDNETNSETSEEQVEFDYGVDDETLQQLLQRLNWSPRVKTLLQLHHKKNKNKNKKNKKEGDTNEGDNKTAYFTLLLTTENRTATW